MGPKIKAGTRGIAAKYITRNTALRKLQLSLADFRRLCILKGVYPRDPKKKPKGQDKTYYHVKDILYLSHEPLIQRFRENHIVDRKYRRAVTRREYSTARAIKKSQPSYTIYHILQERYKTFVEALYDLDDAISTLALVSAIKPRVDCMTADLLSGCVRVLDEFFAFVCHNRLVRKVFCSVKGFYIQIQYLNENITFLLPHELPQEIPENVDFKVISTFTELYFALVSAVNFKSYKLINAKYPPQPNISKLAAGLRFLAFEIEQESPDAENPLINDQLNELLKSNGYSDDSLLKFSKKNEEDSVVQNLFQDCHIYISREVPLFVFALLVKACGVKQVSWQAYDFSAPEDDSSITHQIVDRLLTDHHKQLPCREFIQPQWILDSINAKKLLPIHDYKPGVKLPPHYSPFIAEHQVSQIYKNLAFENNTDEVGHDESTNLNGPNDDASENLNEFRLIENAKEKNESRLKQKRDEEISRRKSLLSKKHKRLLERIEYTSEQQRKAQQKIEKKKVLSKKSKL